MKSQTNKKPSWYQLFQKPVLFIGVLLLLLGIYSYLNTTKGLFPEVEFPRITLIANAGQQQSFQELAMILCLAALLVFTVLLFLIRKWGMSLAILFIAVCGLCGSLIALAITHTPLNVSSYTGMIMVVGIIAENAIFTLNQYDMNRKAGGSVSESVDYAIALRIRPKLMTAISAILALMPLALGFGLGAQMQQPLAIAVIGGFCVALPLLLVVLPTMMLKIMKCDE